MNFSIPDNICRSILSLVWISLAACSGSATESIGGLAQTPATGNPPTAIPHSSPTPTGELFTKTPRPTFTLRPPTNTPSIPLEAHYRVNCLNVIEGSPSDLGLKGTLVYPKNNEHPSFFWDLPTDRKTPLPHEEDGDYFGLKVSPNGKWLAAYQYIYSGPESQFLRIFDNQGNQTVTLPLNDRWSSLFTWTDDSRLLFAVGNDNDEQGDLVYQTGVLNPFTQNQSFLNQDLPNLYPFQLRSSWGLFSGTMTSYSPDLTQVVYLTSSNYVLWDTVKEEVITIIEHPNNILSDAAPIWSPRGNQFVLAITTNEIFDELLLMDKEGQIIQQTNLKAYFDQGPEKKGLYLRNYSWSPDGRYIAFFLQPRSAYSSNDVKHLAVLDTETQEVTDLCLPGYFEGTSGRSPLWSPDGSYFLIGSRDATTENQRTIIIDPREKLAYQIFVEEFRGGAQGWMN